MDKKTQYIDQRKPWPRALQAEVDRHQDTKAELARKLALLDFAHVTINCHLATIADLREQAGKAIDTLAMYREDAAHSERIIRTYRIDLAGTQADLAAARAQVKP